MPTVIALLTGINVGGNHKVPMARLREMTVGLGFSNPRTVLQSGNLVFESPHVPDAGMLTRLEDAHEAEFGFRSRYLLRSEDEWNTILAANPFADFAALDPSHLVIVFMRESLSTGVVEAMQAAVTGREMLAVTGRELWICYPDGIGTSTLDRDLRKAKLRFEGTARNWNTIQKLAALITDSS